jgi:hypothetical protein
MKNQISYVRNFIFIALACCLLVGCSDDKSIVKGETKSVKWFMDHPEERSKVLIVCEERTELRDQPNCKKAKLAEVGLKTMKDLDKIHFDWSKPGKE